MVPKLPLWQKFQTAPHSWTIIDLWDRLVQRKLSHLMTKSTKWHVRPAKTQISLCIRPVWSESLLSMWRKLGSLASHWAQSKDSDQTGRMPRLIWVFAWCTVTLLVLSCGGSVVLHRGLGCKTAYVSNFECQFWCHLSLVTRKPVFGVSDQVRPNRPAQLQRPARVLKFWILASIGIILSK